MKKIEINYTTNEQLWTLETVAEAHGYNKKNDCYWAQIFENAAGDQIITSREDTASADPAADLAALLDENTTEAHQAGKEHAMTSKEAYNMDLDELRTAIDALLAAVPSSTKRSDAHRREEAERVASSARALIGCMRNDYIVAE